jgi:hypothetical protein
MEVSLAAVVVVEEVELHEIALDEVTAAAVVVVGRVRLTHREVVVGQAKVVARAVPQAEVVPSVGPVEAARAL